jgi:hypothetical protein
VAMLHQRTLRLRHNRRTDSVAGTFALEIPQNGCPIRTGLVGPTGKRSRTIPPLLPEASRVHPEPDGLFSSLTCGLRVEGHSIQNVTYIATLTQTVGDGKGPQATPSGSSGTGRGPWPPTSTRCYPRGPLASELAGSPERGAEVLAMLRHLQADHLIAGGRVYGGGLHKLEPRELARLPLAHDCVLPPAQT